MSARPRLELARIVAFSGEAEEEVADNLEYVLSVEHASLDDVELEGEPAVEVLFELSWKLFDPAHADEGGDHEDEDEQGDGSVVSMSATFRLVYSHAPEDEDERVTLATRRALLDVWPRFVMWLNGQLATLGLYPTELSPRPPRDLLDDARAAFERTADEDDA